MVMSVGLQPTLVRLPQDPLGEERGDVLVRDDRTSRALQSLRQKRPCFLEQLRTDQGVVALIAGVNSDWRHESDESRPGNWLGAIVLPALRGPKAKSAALGVALDNRPHRSSKCGYARSGRLYAATPSKLISRAEWTSYFHRIALQRRRRARLCSARGRPDFLHPGKARSVRSFLRDAIDHFRRRLVPLQHHLDDPPSRFFGSLPVVGPILAGLWLFISALVHLGLLVIMIIAMVKAFMGARWDIPFIGPIARKQMGETP